jgi:galactokinase
MDTTKLLQSPRDAIENFPIAFHDHDEVEYASPLGVAWAPGRVNLIGEHTDYNNGFVLPLAVDHVAAFAGHMRNDALVRLWSLHFKEYAQFSLEGLPGTFEQQRAQLPGWARYILGVASKLVEEANQTLRGFDVVMGGDVPLGGGMSSSAALEVASAQAFSLFSGGSFTIGDSGASLSPMRVATVCQRAEWVASGVRCGILDQAASCLGQPQHAVLIDCRSLDYRYLPFDAPTLSLMVIDTGVRHELASTAYNERRQQCEEAALMLRNLAAQHEPDNVQASNIQSLRDVTPELFQCYKQHLPPVLCKRAGYIIAENERVLKTVALLEAGKVEEVGPILWQGHAGLRDEYEVSCTELDVLVEIAQQTPGVLGGRMMGGGFGGCTVNLVRNDAIEALRQAVKEQYPARTGRQAYIETCRAAAGAGQTWVS